jgi:hypothetical protein
MVTRRDEEFSGNSSCSDCMPELDSVAIEAFRMISIGALLWLQNASRTI